jgi:hypothetical protein
MGAAIVADGTHLDVSSNPPKVRAKHNTGKDLTTKFAEQVLRFRQRQAQLLRRSPHDPPLKPANLDRLLRHRATPNMHRPEIIAVQVEGSGTGAGDPGSKVELTSTLVNDGTPGSLILCENSPATSSGLLSDPSKSCGGPMSIKVVAPWSGMEEVNHSSAVGADQNSTFVKVAATPFTVPSTVLKRKARPEIILSGVGNCGRLKVIAPLS